MSVFSIKYQRRFCVLSLPRFYEHSTRFPCLFISAYCRVPPRYSVNKYKLFKKYKLLNKYTNSSIKTHSSRNTNSSRNTIVLYHNSISHPCLSKLGLIYMLIYIMPTQYRTIHSQTQYNYTIQLHNTIINNITIQVCGHIHNNIVLYFRCYVVYECYH